MNIVMSKATSRGSKHETNEDQCFAFPETGLALVADGMSVNHGHVASAIAAQMIEEYVKRSVSDESARANLLKEAVLAANFAIHRYALANPVMMGMGTTVTLAQIFASRIFIAHVGDSRCLRIRPESVTQLTVDHAERRAAEDSYMLTRSVGIDETVQVDLVTSEVEPGDFVLLCSDGLTSYVPEEEILRAFRKYDAWKGSASPEFLDRILGDLSRAARVRGSDDDITIVLAKVVEGTAQ